MAENEVENKEQTANIQESAPAQEQVQEPAKQEQSRQPARPEIDLSEIHAMRSEIENLKQDTGKLRKIKEVFSEEDKQADNEKFFKELAENPIETIEKITTGKASEKIERLEKQLYEKELKENDAIILSRLKSQDNDYDTVFANMSKYVNEEDFKKYQTDPNRSEIWYSLAKQRMTADLLNKKNEQNKANTVAKNIVNQTASSEIPTNNNSADEFTNDLDRNISKAREEGRWNKGEGFSQLDNDIFARFHRDAYGIKPRQ